MWRVEVVGMVKKNNSIKVTHALRADGQLTSALSKFISTKQTVSTKLIISFTKEYRRTKFKNQVKKTIFALYTESKLKYRY